MIAVRAGQTTIRLSIVPIEDIRPHERTIPPLLGSIMNNMRRTGYQRDPILIDERSHLALDGMHRLKSLKLLGARYAACALFNASDDSVKVERWLRTFIAPDKSLVDSIVKKFGMTWCSNFRSAIKKVESGKSKIALVSRDDCYSGGKEMKISDVYRKIGEVDTICEKNHLDLHFLTEAERFHLFSSGSVEMLYPAKLSKPQIAKFAARLELLPHKTTRYIVPVRPMGLCFPLSSLQEESLSQCDKTLERIVKLSKATLERKNVWYEGRRYSEHLAIFRKMPNRQSEGAIPREPT